MSDDACLQALTLALEHEEEYRTHRLAHAESLDAEAYKAREQVAVSDDKIAELRAGIERMRARQYRPDEPCICKPPPMTDGPEETCPVHGRPYSYWVDAASRTTDL